MCGIAGYIGTRRIDPRRVGRTLGLMNHRGPDHAAAEKWSLGEIFVHLLHSRLSIIDPDPRSHQPLTLGPCTVVFNGEIYNYVELRERLESAGVSFQTTSDTEVLLQAYLREGPECVEHFEGMWALAIYDRARGRLFLSRDRFGEKPLYYRVAPTGVLFGSEIKFLQALSGEAFTPARRQVLRYLWQGYKALHKSSDTFFEGLQHFPAATSMVVDDRLRRRLWRYWQPHFQTARISLQDSVDGVRERLLNSVRLRLRADVPVAFCLSGGVDSAALASLACRRLEHPVHAFSIMDPDPRYGEGDNIAATVRDLDCAHTAVRLTPAGDLRQLHSLIAYHDGPLYTISYYVHALLCREMAARGFRVAVSGIGADELVSGYYDHFLLQLYELREHRDLAVRLEDWHRHIRRLVRNPRLRNPGLYVQNPGFRGHIYAADEVVRPCLQPADLEPFAEQRYCDTLMRNRMLNELFHESIPVLLHEDDLNSMYHSIENRSPYLDRALVEFCCGLPPEHLIRDGYAKYVLREALAGILNDRVRLDRRKVGFNAAIESVFDVRCCGLREQILDNHGLGDYIDRDGLGALLARERWSNEEGKFLFAVLNTSIFLEQHRQAVADVTDTVSNRGVCRG